MGGSNPTPLIRRGLDLYGFVHTHFGKYFNIFGRLLSRFPFTFTACETTRDIKANFV